MKKLTSPENLTENIFNLIGKDWALITTVKPDGGYNTMTASWGGMGILWNKPVCFIFVRPQRYTYQLLEQTDCFSLSFFDDSYREKLSYCGKVSGRDFDKIAQCGFSLTKSRENPTCAYIDESKLSVCCKKLYFGDILESGFIDKDLLSNYASKDYHRMYIAEITGIYSAE